MRTRYAPARSRKILCVFPRYAPSFGTFQHAYPLFGGRIAGFMPPQGLLVIAAYLPECWDVRFVDENLGPAAEADFRWADAVFVSGMHVQRPQIEDVILRAHASERTINILYALPKTPLWRRLAGEGRVLDNGARESNVVFKLPYETVLALWRTCITRVYAPEAVYARFAYHQRHTLPNRTAFPQNAARASWPNVAMGLSALARIIWRIGIRGDYRRTFWRMAAPALRSGKIDQVIHIAVVTHHLIEFTRDCARGVGEVSFYAPAAPATPTAVDERYANLVGC